MTETHLVEEALRTRCSAIGFLLLFVFPEEDRALKLPLHQNLFLAYVRARRAIEAMEVVPPANELDHSIKPSIPCPSRTVDGL